MFLCTEPKVVFLRLHCSVTSWCTKSMKAFNGTTCRSKNSVNQQTSKSRRDAPIVSAEPKVLLHGQVSVHDVVLGHETDDALVGLDVARLSVDQHLPRHVAVSLLSRDSCQEH